MSDADRWAIYASVGAVTVAAATAFAYFYFTSADRRVRGVLRGLYNDHNVCYANALMQALSASERYTAWLHSIAAIVNDDDCLQRCAPLIKGLHYVERAINYTLPDDADFSSTSTACSTAPLLSLLRERGWTIPEYQHQDIHELYAVVNEAVEEDLKKLTTNNEELNLPREPYCFDKATLVYCTTCNYKNAHIEQFNAVTVALPNPVATSLETLTLSNCLRTQFGIERLHDARCEKCHKTKTMVRRTLAITVLYIRSSFEYIFFYRCPLSWSSSCHVLALHKMYSRKMIEGFAKAHCNCLVDFDTRLNLHEMLHRLPNADNVLSTVPKERREEFTRTGYYRLRGVCVHRGSLSSVGHYITYRRLLAHRVDARWYRCDDTRIEHTPLSDVTSQVAYMLVYDRLPDETASS